MPVMKKLKSKYHISVTNLTNEELMMEHSNHSSSTSMKSHHNATAQAPPPVDSQSINTSQYYSGTYLTIMDGNGNKSYVSEINDLRDNLNYSNETCQQSFLNVDANPAYKQTNMLVEKQNKKAVHEDTLGQQSGSHYYDYPKIVTPQSYTNHNGLTENSSVSPSEVEDITLMESINDYGYEN